MKRDDVWAIVKRTAPLYEFDPLLFLALCEQESIDPDEPTIYRDRAARLEQGFYVNYTEKEDFATTTEVLYATSYGLTQMLGESLDHVGYFDWWFSLQTPMSQAFLQSAKQDIAVVKAINEYMTHPEWQIERGCMWLKKKQKLAGSDTTKMLRLWNGDISGAHHYAENVLARKAKLATIYKV